MTYETPVVQEIGNAEELTLGALHEDGVDYAGWYRKIPNQL
jgi:hypothetical protein